MQYAKFAMKPVALLVAILLGGCVGYTDYPSGDYGYSLRHSQPTYGYNGYSSGYDGRPSYSQRSYYLPYYGHAASAAATDAPWEGHHTKSRIGSRNDTGDETATARTGGTADQLRP